MIPAEGTSAPSAPAGHLAERDIAGLLFTAEMYGVLHQGQSPRTALQRLMTRSLKAEAAP